VIELAVEGGGPEQPCTVQLKPALAGGALKVLVSCPEKRSGHSAGEQPVSLLLAEESWQPAGEQPVSLLLAAQPAAGSVTHWWAVSTGATASALKQEAL
jgi:hypothetical protein